MKTGRQTLSIPDSPAGSVPSARLLARGRDWHVSEHLCNAGPGDRPFDERHEAFTIAAVLEGTFTYRSDRGRSLLVPGALLLGNLGSNFCCGHEHARGDRCIAFHFAPECFEEVAAGASGTARFRFPTGALPPSAATVRALARIEAGLARNEPLGIDEATLALAASVIRAVSDGSASDARSRVSIADERRVTRAARHIAEHAAEPLDLEQLAALAAMSKYHFLRTFRRTIGVTPYQFVLGSRLRRAARALVDTDAPVAEVATDAGFGDLSSFNARFRAAFGQSPSSYRASGRRRP